MAGTYLSHAQCHAGSGVAVAQASELLCSYHGVLSRALQQDLASCCHEGMACVGLPQRLSFSKPVAITRHTRERESISHTYAAARSAARDSAAVTCVKISTHRRWICARPCIAVSRALTACSRGGGTLWLPCEAAALPLAMSIISPCCRESWSLRVDRESSLSGLQC
jgi:hypothetical protein